MRRLPLAVTAASVLAAAALPATASATEVQIGATSTALVAPTCPQGATASQCQILLTKQTALQTLSDGASSPEIVKQPGVLSSYTVGVSSAAISFKAVSTLNKQYGGPPEVAITVLRPFGVGKTARWIVAAESPAQNVTSYQGSVVQIPLLQALPVVKGEVIALTTPTWAPVLSIGLSSSFSYAQSKVGNCQYNSKLPTYYNPQTLIGQQVTYGCNYAKTRVEYSATEITTPTVAASYRLAGHLLSAARPRIIKR